MKALIDSPDELEALLQLEAGSAAIETVKSLAKITSTADQTAVNKIIGMLERIAANL